MSDSLDTTSDPLTGDHVDAQQVVLPDTPVNAEVWARTPYNPEDYGPVSEWATDFDHSDPAYNPMAPEIWKSLIEGGCPVARTDRYGGMVVPLTHDLVSEVAYDTDRFSSRSIVVSHSRPGDLGPPAPIGVAPPISSDPPFHQMVRRLLLPAFAPKRIEALRGEVVSLCEHLADGLDTSGSIDAALDYAQHIPVAVIGKMLGFPESDADLFRSFVHTTLEMADQPPAERFAAFAQLFEYIERQIDDHVANPRDDLTNYLLNVEIDGNPLPHQQAGSMIVLLLVAGIDTTWSAIGSSLMHLAQHRDDRERYGREPQIRALAVEEFLRFYAPVTMARLATQDTELGGCPVTRDDWLLLPFPAANHDPEHFERAEEFIIDREVNRHAAFGLGIHRCLGSNLARLELSVALDVWVDRFPEFELAGPVTWSKGQVRGPRSIPVRV
jgi:cytochrome P450